MLNINVFRRLVPLVLFLGAAAASFVVASPPADPLSPPANGPRRADPTYQALINATVHVSPTKTIEYATVVIRDGRIESVTATTPPPPPPPPAPAPAPAAGAPVQAPGAATPGAAATPAQPGSPAPSGAPATPAAAPPAPAPVIDSPAPPPGAQVWDCRDLHIYAGFIEPYLEIEAPNPDRDAPGSHWNAKVMPQRNALDGKGLDEGSAKSLRSMGFVAAGVSPKRGIFRGSSAVVSLAEPDKDLSQPRPNVYVKQAYETVAFEMAGGGDNIQRWDGYPDSEMGCIALIRQTLIDADWEAQRKAAGLDAGKPNALDALGPVNGGKPLPLVISVDDELEVIRADKIAREFKRDAVILGCGTEFRRLDAIAADHPMMIIPLNFPKKPSANSVGDADALELRELMTWEQAPTNVRRLDGAGVKVVLTTSKTKDRSAFTENLRTAIKHGLQEEHALAMLTTSPAKLLALGDQLGTVEQGKRASLIVADGPIFAKKTKLRDVWIDGKRHELNKAPIKLTGQWEMTVTPPPPGAGTRSLSIDKDNNITVIRTDPDGKEVTAKAANVRVEGGRVAFTFDHEPFGASGIYTLSGIIEGEKLDTMMGDAFTSDGHRFSWLAVRTSTEPAKPKKDDKKDEKAGDKKDDKADKDKGEKKDEKKDEPAKPEPAKEDPISGVWSLTLTGPNMPEIPVTFSLKRDESGSVTGSFSGPMGGADVQSGSFNAATGTLTAVVASPEGNADVTLKVSGTSMTGTATMAGMTLNLSGTRTSSVASDKKDDDDEPVDVPEKLPGYPFGPYAYEAIPDQPGAILFTNATVWTSGPQGTIQNASVLVQKGKIAAVSVATIPVPAGAVVIDLKGKHLTPGIIDCHSHTGISRGVNEAGQAVTAEVRIGDVTNPDSISWYRQLAAGVTTVNSLHGSANPIGGQNQVNKNRWGAISPDDLHFVGAPEGIKFALGENVKQSNWGDRFTNRYPQTRMGVDTLIRDRFYAAQEYLAAMNDASQQIEKIKLLRLAPEEQTRRIAAITVRRDLELEALAEILQGKRLIHCHSYRQDEILMLCRVAQDFGFKIGSFQHILEGYKVADMVRDYSGGGSCFADWWAYKIEVQDAIPQAGPIMHEVGVVVSYNSDSDEMARRLNVEAAKAVKYSSGHVSPDEALKFVTLNPAKQLKIDGTVGSIEVGKDADLVVWSGPPLSSMSRAEQTWIDGRCYWSLEKDAALREVIAKERQRLLQKVLGAKKPKKDDAKGKDAKPDGAKPDDTKKDAPAKPADAAPVETPSKPPHDLTGGPDEGRPMSLVARMIEQSRILRRDMYMDYLRRGINPELARPGMCGCEELK